MNDEEEQQEEVDVRDQFNEIGSKQKYQTLGDLEKTKNFVIPMKFGEYIDVMTELKQKNPSNAMDNAIIYDLDLNSTGPWSTPKRGTYWVTNEHDATLVKKLLVMKRLSKRS